jgi:hypothetical protein
MIKRIKMIYCKPVSIPHKPITDINIITSSAKSGHDHASLDPSEKGPLNSDFVEYLKELGLRIGSAEVFYVTKNHASGIHIDGNIITDKIKLNYIYGGINSTMNWYMPNELTSGKLFTTIHGDGYMLYDKTEVHQVHEAKLENSYLVQVGVPHNVLNYGVDTQERWCLSLVLYHESKRLTMDKAIEVFGSHCNS